MKKLVLFISLIAVFSLSAKAQDIKEVDLFSTYPLEEITVFPAKTFEALKIAVENAQIGKIEAIVALSGANQYLVMSTEKNFYLSSYDSEKKIAYINETAITEKNAKELFAKGDVLYILRSPEHRIPTDIPNDQNVLDPLN